ncbi:MAG: histidinol-phosphate transaminase [Oscillospiraceae bacterium]
MRLSERLARLTPFSYCGKDYPIRLDANESCVPLSNEIREEISAAVREMAFERYPDDTTEALRCAFADAFATDASCVVPGNGSDELINMIVGRLIPDEGVVLGIEHDFGSYWSNASIFGRKVVKLPRRIDMSFTVDDLIGGASLYSADMVVFSNPNNPSGGMLPRDEVVRLIESLSCLVVVDEAYMDFANQSILDLAGRYDNLIVLRTLSKAVGLAGARLGFAVSTPCLAYALRSVRDAYNVSALDQLVGRIVLSHPEQRVRTLAETKRLMTLMMNRLNEMARRADGRMTVYPSVTNYVLMRLDDAEVICEGLHRKGISLRLVDSQLLRISLADEETLTMVLNELETLVTKSKEDAR